MTLPDASYDPFQLLTAGAPAEPSDMRFIHVPPVVLALVKTLTALDAVPVSRL
jgi:hypothetical protein